MMLPLKCFCHVSNFFSKSVSFWVCFILWISLSRWQIAVWEVQISAHSKMSYHFNGSFFHFAVLLCYGYNTLKSSQAQGPVREKSWFLKERGKGYTFVDFFLSIWYWQSIRLSSNIVKDDDLSFSLVYKANAILLSLFLLFSVQNAVHFMKLNMFLLSRLIFFFFKLDTW